MSLTINDIELSVYIGSNNSRCIIWDKNIPGFGLRIYPSGKKTFIIEYRVRKIKKMKTIGYYGIFTLDQARKFAVEKLNKLRHYQTSSAALPM